MLQVWLANSLQAVGLYQFHNVLKARSDISRERVESRFGFLIEKADGPWHLTSIPFLQ
jgi:hypothetical protein